MDTWASLSCLGISKLNAIHRSNTDDIMAQTMSVYKSMCHTFSLRRHLSEKIIYDWLTKFCRPPRLIRLADDEVWKEVWKDLEFEEIEEIKREGGGRKNNWMGSVDEERKQDEEMGRGGDDKEVEGSGWEGE